MPSSTALAIGPSDRSASARPARDDWRLRIPEPHRRSLRRWLWAVATVTALVVALGGITRLTQSGLSIVDWQPVAGIIPPLTQQQWEHAFERYRAFPEYQQLRRGMTLGEFQFIFFWEYVHRIAARLIGIVFLVPFLLFWARGSLTRPLLKRTLVLFALGAAQGLLGWLMVKSGLVDRPSVSHYRLAAHLTLAFVIFGYCIWLVRDLAVQPIRSPAAPARPALVAALVAMGLLLGVQVVYGAFVAGLKAGLMLNTFPLMAGELMPAWLLAGEPVLPLFLQDPAVVQWMHRLLGTLLLGAAIVLFLWVRRLGLDARSTRLCAALALLVAAQYLLGVLTLLYLVPIALGVAHQLLALIVFGVWVVWLHEARQGVFTAQDAGT